MEQEFVTDVDDGPVLKLKFEISSEKPNDTEEIDNSDADSFEGKYHFLYFRKEISLTCSNHVEIEEDEETFSRALEVLDHGAENRRSFHDMGDYLMDIFRKTRKKRPIHNCISAYRFAVGITPPDEPEFIPFACDAGLAYLARYELTHNVKDLHGVVKYTEMSHNAIATRTDQDDLKAALLNTLAIAYTGIFEQTGVVTHLFKAISYQEKALALVSDGDERMPSLLDTLADTLSLSYTNTKNLSDLNQAISYLQKSIEATPTGHPARVNRLNHLSQLFIQRYQFTKDPNDLQNAVRITPDDHEKIVDLLYLLETVLVYRHVDGEGEVYLSEAISYAQKAIHLAPEGHQLLPKLLNDLGFCLTVRYTLNGDGSDIAEAAVCLNKAVMLTPEGHSDMPLLLHNLGKTFLLSFEASARVDNINSFVYRTNLSAAIPTLRKAVNLAPEDHENMPMFLNTLGVALLRNFEVQGDIDDLNQAILFQRKAVNLTLRGDADITLRLKDLGVSLQQRFKSTRNIVDLSEAISLQQKAVGLIEDGHINKTDMLDRLGDLFADRAAESKGDLSDIQAAISNYSLSATSPKGQYGLQLIAAQKWAKLAQKFTRPDVLDAYSVAMNLISRAAGLDKPIRKRLVTLQLYDVSNISRMAATVASSLGRHDLALEWLEQGRCLIWNQINNLRTPLDPKIRSFDQALADEVLRVSNALENTGSRAEARFGATTAEKMAVQGKVTEHLKLSQDWDRVLTRVRNIPGFEDFLNPPSCSFLLQNLPESAILVMINVHEERCDAIALLHGSSEPLNIPLPGFSQAKAENLRKRLKNHLKGSGRMVREVDSDVRGTKPYSQCHMKDILRELWVSVVQPILNGLAFQVSRLVKIALIVEHSGRTPHLNYHIFGGVRLVPWHFCPYMRQEYTTTLQMLHPLSPNLRFLPIRLLLKHLSTG